MSNTNENIGMRMVAIAAQSLGKLWKHSKCSILYGMRLSVGQSRLRQWLKLLEDVYYNTNETTKGKDYFYTVVIKIAQ